MLFARFYNISVFFAQHVDKKSIMISGNNIKQIGKYIAKIRLHREVIIDFPFEVVSEKK